MNRGASTFLGVIAAGLTVFCATAAVLTACAFAAYGAFLLYGWCASFGFVGVCAFWIAVSAAVFTAFSFAQAAMWSAIV